MLRSLAVLKVVSDGQNQRAILEPRKLAAVRGWGVFVWRDSEYECHVFWLILAKRARIDGCAVRGMELF